MSRLYFHSPSGTAEVAGAERAWLAHVGTGPGTYAWNITHSNERAQDLVALIDMTSDRGRRVDYLVGQAERAAETSRRYREDWQAYETTARAAGTYDARRGPRFDPEPGQRFLSGLQTCLKVQGFDIAVAGYRLSTADLEYNTALVAGSDVVALAAKLHGWSEVHTWVEGPERAWLADLVAEGLRTGILREGILCADAPDGPRERWHDLGWRALIGFLRERDDEPVVTSYSVTDSFPNRYISDWTPPELPADWAPEWATDRRGADEWAGYDPAKRDELRTEAADELWYGLPPDEQWAGAMRGLRVQRPWARLAPDTLREVFFGPAVTVYDLWAHDRDERIRAACAQETGARGAP